MAISPGAESVQKARAAAEREDAFWRDHYDEYLGRFPDQFVAVAQRDGRLVATNPDLDKLIETIREQGLNVRDVWSRFMAATPIRLAL